MKFYDRTKEMAMFADIYERSRQEAQMTVLVGRRRIGKTELALRCGHDGPLLYFCVALKESNMYTEIGQYWDRKGENEIDIVAINEIDHVADIFEVKKQKAKYDEALLREKVENFSVACPELRKYDIRLGCLSMEDM